MRIELPILQGTFIKRYKRFLADVQLQDGQIVTVHCPNSGAMTGCAIPGAVAYISDSMNPKRKLKYTLEVIESDGTSICVNTHRANGLVEEAIRADRIKALRGYQDVEREVRYGQEKSRIDLLLRQGESLCYVEVKNVTLGGAHGVVAFPDAVTERGTKHLRELMAMKAEGHRSALVYCVSRTDARAVRPADEIDPLYAQTLKEACDKGVEVYALKAQIKMPELELIMEIPVQM